MRLWLPAIRRALTTPAVAAVVVVVVVLLLAGCGGSGSGGGLPAASGSPVGQRLIASADEICERLNERLIATAPARNASSGVLARNALAHARLEHTAIAELVRLSPPAGLRRDWGQIVAERQLLASQLLSAARALRANDKHQLAVLSQAKLRAHNAMSLIARRDGFGACTKIGTAA